MRIQEKRIVTIDPDCAITRRIPTYAWGKEFVHIPEHVRSDLHTLTRECAVYYDHWIDEIGDFRHVRIDFTEEEREEYFRRSWAYELFLRAGMPKWAVDTPGIDSEVAKDADTYSPTLRDGFQIPPPYHCFAAFLGNHLERLTCGRTDRQTVIDLKGREAIKYDVARTIGTLTPTIRSFNNRERGLNPWSIGCEDDVRDLLYVMLRARLFDVTKEEPVPSTAGTYSVVDLCSNSARLLIEVKWISSKGSWKRILSQIFDDIQKYPMHPSYENLWFVVVDNVKDIPDPMQFKGEITGLQTLRGRDVNIRAFVCET